MCFHALKRSLCPAIACSAKLACPYGMSSCSMPFISPCHGYKRNGQPARRSGRSGCVGLFCIFGERTSLTNNHSLLGPMTQDQTTDSIIQNKTALGKLCNDSLLEIFMFDFVVDQRACGNLPEKWHWHGKDEIAVRIHLS